MTTRYDACTGRKDKSGKTYWTKIGAAFPAKDGKEGFNIVLDALPMPNAEGQAWISLFVPKPKKDDQGQHAASEQQDPAGTNADMDDEIPF